MEYIKHTIKKAAKEQLEKGRKAVNKRLNINIPTIAKIPHHNKKSRAEKKGKSAQKQKQHQIVNIHIDNGGDGGGGGRKRQSVIPQLPSNIFDPSLILPHYGINDRQSVNPPDMEGPDMTGLLSSIISQIRQPQQTQTQQTQPQQVQPQQTVTPIPTNTEDDKPIKVEPIKVKPQPHDENIVKEPDVIDNNFDIDRIIENMKNKKKKLKEKEMHDIASQILPPGSNTPKLPKQKYKDTEGLGTKIPLGRVGEIGLAALGGAELGALTLAADAAYAGGAELLTSGSLSGALASAGERITVPSIVGYVGGGAVGTGVSNALGGGENANIIAGLASSIVTRQALKKYNKIQTAHQQKVNETTPLLNNGKRLGGKKTGKSNLVPPEPEQQAKQSTSMIDTIKTIATKKAKDATEHVQYLQNKISEGISSVKQRMTTGGNKGTYTRVPTTFAEDYMVPSQPLPELDFETEYAKLQHKHLPQPQAPKTKLRESPAVGVQEPVIRSGMRLRKNAGNIAKQIQFKPNSPKPKMKATYAVIPQSKNRQISTQTEPSAVVNNFTQTIQTGNPRAIQNLGMLSDGILLQKKQLNTMEGLEKLIKGKKKQHNVQNFGDLAQGVLASSSKNTLEGYKQAVTKSRKTTSNLAHLSQRAIDANTVQPETRQVILRSGTITSEPRTKANVSAAAVKAFREKAPETTRLTNQIADITRGRVSATPEKLANLKAQREEAKLKEGVGKRGPKGATPKKLSKKAVKLPKK